MNYQQFISQLELYLFSNWITFHKDLDPNKELVNGDSIRITIDNDFKEKLELHSRMDHELEEMGKIFDEINFSLNRLKKNIEKFPHYKENPIAKNKNIRIKDLDMLSKVDRDAIKKRIGISKKNQSFRRFDKVVFLLN